MWTVASVTDSATDTLDMIASVLKDPRPKFPSKLQSLGETTVEWWEPEPGTAVIMAKGGSFDDRTLAEQIAREQLAPFGIKRAQFTLWANTLRKTADWAKIMAKAKRLIESGQVQILRNGYNNIVAHVVGDHGEYNCEIGRDDPNSQSITTWQCECPWDQYAWGRTRKWKKYEGRCCAHVLAAYWKAKATPLDDDVSEDQKAQLGPGQNMGLPPGPGGAGGGGAGVPGGPMPSVPPMPGGPVEQPQPNVEVPQGPAAGPPMAPPGPPGVLPQSPMEQLQEMQPPGPPGTAPVGMPAPPGSVSVPGARPQTPFGPVQYPGGTYSKVSADFQPPMVVRATKPLFGQMEGKSEAHGAGGYREVPEGSPGEVIHQDESTGWVECIFPLEDTGELEPYLVRCFVEPSDIEATTIRPQSPWIRRR